MAERAPRKEVPKITPEIQAIIDGLKDLPADVIEERVAYSQQLEEEHGLVEAAIRGHYTHLVSDALTAKVLPEGVGKELLRLLEEKDEEGVRAIMEQHNIPVIYKEMLEGVLVMRNFDPWIVAKIFMDPHDVERLPYMGEVLPAGESPETAFDILEDKRLIFAGEGSSIAIPGQIAEGLAVKHGIKPGRVVTGNCPEIQDINSEDIVIISSNSGETATALDLARRAKKAGAMTVAVTSNKDSQLAELCDKKAILACGKEEAVGATKSVLEQALMTGAIVNESVGITDTDINSISYPFEENLLQEIPISVIRAIAKADRLVIVGENGFPEELQLKAGETLGVKTSVVQLSDIMHGIEEAMDRRDCVLVFNPTKETVRKIEEKIVTRTSKDPLKEGVPVFYIVPEGEDVLAYDPEEVEKDMEQRGRIIEYSYHSDSDSEEALSQGALMHLAIGQNLLARAAYYTGNECVPENARKVGDEAGSLEETMH